MASSDARGMGASGQIPHQLPGLNVGSNCDVAFPSLANGGDRRLARTVLDGIGMTEAQMHDRFDRLEALMKAESVETRAYVDERLSVTHAYVDECFSETRIYIDEHLSETRAYVDLRWTDLCDYVGLEAKKTREHFDAVVERLETRTRSSPKGTPRSARVRGSSRAGRPGSRRDRMNSSCGKRDSRSDSVLGAALVWRNFSSAAPPTPCASPRTRRGAT